VKLHVDLDTLQLVAGPGQGSPPAPWVVKRGDTRTVDVVFLDAGLTPATIGDPDALEIRLGIKPARAFASDYLAHTAAFTMPQPGAEPVYRASLCFNTVELDAALHVGESGELAELPLMAELTWRVDGGDPVSTRNFTVVVENDVNRGTEGLPQHANPPYPAPQDLALRSEVLRHDIPQTLSSGAMAQARDNLGLQQWIGTVMISVSQVNELEAAFSAWLQASGLPANKVDLAGPAQTISSPLTLTEDLTLDGTVISGVGDVFFADARPAVRGTVSDVTANRIVIFDGTSGRVLKAHTPSAVNNLAASPTTAQIATAFNDLLAKLRSIGIIS
jgi:hypothetical protein